MELTTLAQVFAAIGTVAVAILAIWGDKIRAAIAGPKIEFGLNDPKGNLTIRGNKKRTIFYHLQLQNKRTWSPASHTRVLVTGIEKKRPDGTYFPESLIAPLQLTWAFPQFHELLPTIATRDVCDLGYLDEDSQRFELSLYIKPNNFMGFVEPGQSMRAKILVSAHNYESKKAIIFEVSWDGKWDSNLEEMQKHLVIKEVHGAN